jgi:uncharacterized membrane protein YkvA (DUF1232 family)
MPLLQQAKQWAWALKRDVVALWIAARDQRTPWYAKAVAGGVAAYALSPIDLIPDFVPVLGYVDDLLVVPLGVLLAIKLIPAELMTEYRALAVSRDRPVSKAGLAVIVAIWLVSALLIGWWLLGRHLEL